MKNYLYGSIVIVILLSLLGCQHDTTQTDHIDTNKDLNGFVELKPSDWVKYIKPIREYMYYRTQATVNKDIDQLWNKYPDLQENINQLQGINIEKFEVEFFKNSFDLLDANYDIEKYGKIKVKFVNDTEVIVLVHGSIEYIRDDFDLSGGEHLIRVFLQQKDKGWTVVKTDEHTMSELKDS
ncbi:MAG: hypothetical protein ACE3L7_26200 [Candidatus Pristimantibacillus sp.]